MPRETAFFQRLPLLNGTFARRCQRCLFVNGANIKVCRACGRRLVKRPKVKRKRSVDAELAKAESQLDHFLAVITRAVNRIRYYRKRVAALEKRATEQRKTPIAQRAIRLR